MSKKSEKKDTIINDNMFMEDKSFRKSLKVGHLILWVSIAFIVLMLFWAYFANLEEVTRAQGQVISSSKTQLIQSLEGGIVKEILVKEGQRVKRGQVLARMDDVRFSSNVREGAVREVAHTIRSQRLDAELTGKSFKVDPVTAKKYPDLVSGEMALYHSRNGELQNLYNMKALLEKELKMTEPLVKHGAVSEVELLRLKQRVREVDANIGKFRSGALQQLNAARAESSRLRENNTSLQDRLERTELRSPIKGIVKQIYITTIGGVVNSGVPIMEIVPTEDNLLVEAQVRPQDIGFLHVGQKATIKVTAYDYSIYGGLKGKVAHISADTNVNKKGNSFYEIWVRTDKNHLDKGAKKLQIIPGMQVSVDIITGNKTLLDYLLKPILKTKQTALRER